MLTLAIPGTIVAAGVIALVRQSCFDLRFGTVLEGEAVINDAAAGYVFADALARPDAPVPMAWRHVLVWTGLRGGVAVALALALPPMLPQRDAVAAAVLGLVLWTLIGQALLVEPLMRWTGLRATPPLGRTVPKPAD